MTKYIDAELLREEIERLKEEYNEQVSARLISESLVSMGKVEALNKILAFIESLQQEQQDENLDEAACDYGIRGNSNGVGGEDYANDLAIAFKAGAQWMKDQLTVK